MTGALKKAALVLLSEKCFEEYFMEYNFLHMDCFKATLSKALGLAIISASCLVKVPQILKIFNGKSAKGINILSVFFDLFAITAMASYSYTSGFPFSAWGDGVFLGIQTVTIAALVFYYNGSTTQATSFVAGYAAIVAAVIAGMVPINLLLACQTMNIPIVLTGKLMQAYTNYSYGSTGQLSAATGFMLFFGSLARIFTSIQETGDITMIIMYIVSTAANAVLVFQILYYWNVTTSPAEKTKKVQ